MSPIGLAVCLVLLQSPQDPEVPEILSRMDAALREARGTSFHCKRPGDSGVYTLYQVASDGAVGISNLGVLSRTAAREGLYLQDREYFPTEFLTWEKFQVGAQVHANFLVFQPEGWILQALAPDRTIPFGHRLRLDGRRRVDGEECFVLSARFPAHVPLQRQGGGFCGTGVFHRIENRVRWFVGVADSRLKVIEDRSIFNPSGRDSITTVRFLEWMGGVPGRILVEHRLESTDEVHLDEYHVVSLKTGLDIPPESVRPPRGEYVATRGWDPSVIADVEASPDNPDLLYSAALYHLRTTPGDPVRRPDMGPAISNLEKALALRWGDAPALMLLRLLSEKKETEKLETLLDSIMKRPALSDSLRRAAANALVMRGRADRALQILPRRGSKERIDALVAAGRRREALDELSEVDPEKARGWFELFESLLKDRADGVRAEVDRAIERHPGSPILPNLAMRLAWNHKDPDRFLKVAEEATRRKHGGWVTRMILEHTGYWLSRPYQENNLALPVERVVDLKEAFLRVFEGLDSQPKTAVLQAAVHRICGDRDRAKERLETAISQVPRWANYDQMQMTCPVLLWELEQYGDDELWERGMRACLGELRRLPFPYLIRDHALGRYIKRRLLNGSANRLYHEFKGITFNTRQYSILGAALEFADRKSAAAAILAEARKLPSDPDGHLWLARTIDRDNGEDRSTWDVSSEEFYRKVVVSRPDNVECLDRIARSRQLAKDHGGARDFLIQLLEVLESGDTKPQGVQADQVRIRLADMDCGEGNFERAEKRLRHVAMDAPGLRAWDLWSAAELWNEAGKTEEALTVYGELIRRGYLPHLRIAKIREARGEPVEQVRHLNRAMAEGFDVGPQSRRHEREFMRVNNEDILAMKEKALQDAGPDVFVRAFLSLKQTPLGAREEEAARRAIARLGSDEIEVREAAVAELLKLGPGVSPLLAPVYASDRAALRDTARTVLQQWSDPR